jgi:hypothetical protein
MAFGGYGRIPYRIIRVYTGGVKMSIKGRDLIDAISAAINANGGEDVEVLVEIDGEDDFLSPVYAKPSNPVGAVVIRIQ